jgi:hypothetical protein
MIPTALSDLLTTLAAWRFGTFYANYFLELNDCSNRPATLLGPSQDTLRTVDWARIYMLVSKINVSNETIGVRSA